MFVNFDLPSKILNLSLIDNYQKLVVPKVTFANANVYNCSSKKLTTLNDTLMQI